MCTLDPDPDSDPYPGRDPGPGPDPGPDPDQLYFTSTFPIFIIF